MTSVQPPAFPVVARNLAEHARNAIHTDAGAQAAGFPKALVAGVTTYAYLTHVPAAYWGREWLRSGGGEVRLRRPVFEGDLLECVGRLTEDGSGMTVEASVGAHVPKAVFEAVRTAEPMPARDGEPLQPRTIELVGEWGDYGRRVGDPLALYDDEGIVHPAVWPALANHLVHTQLANGSWIHTRSIVRHHAVAFVGSTAVVHAVVVDRFHRTGERAVIDVTIEVGGELVASLEHEAIVDLGTPA